MMKFVLRRAIQAIPVLFGITIVVYGILLAAPGGPTAKFANNPQMTHEQKEKFKAGLGSRPADPDPVLPLDGLLQPRDRGHLPRLAADSRGVHRTHGLAELPARPRSAAPATASSTATSGTPSTRARRSATGSREPPCRRSSSPAPRSSSGSSIAIVLGVYSAIHRYSLFDNAATVFSYVGFAMPTFWLGIMLIFIFAGTLALAPGERDDRHARLAAVRQRPVLGRTSPATRSRRSATSASTCSCR